MTEPPASLHGRLYLLAFDRDRGRFGSRDPALLVIALRAAKVTDLYLSGHLVDRGGRPYPGRAEGPGDPVLNGAVAQFGFTTQVSWDDAVTRSNQGTTAMVRQQLQAGGWLRPRVHHVPGLSAATCLEPRDEEMVAELAGLVGRTLEQAIAGQTVEPRLLALGLIAVLADLPCVRTFGGDARRSPRLSELVQAAGPPLQALSRVVESYRSTSRSCDGDTDARNGAGFVILW
ncbi:GPP34 family phosphoprotein [Mycobacterium sp. DL592]|uniref:GOLPH3/VPS74 family protein n=1 Tax=Mycobacterium sp. DL592 TaxID=2675524 RepID=UPI001421A7BF|nr:GPP34 family phosphoprotein [Mycobacterium sp. DL592]